MPCCRVSDYPEEEQAMEDRNGERRVIGNDLVQDVTFEWSQRKMEE